MNRSVMQRQMFAGGGAAGLKPIPAGNQGLPNLPENVRNNMGYMAEGGDPMMMPEGIMSTAPAMGAPSPEMMAQQGAEMMDPNTVSQMIEGAEAAGFSDPEAAGSFEEMMNSVSGENKSAEERRSDLASIVGPEDASQTPESVLALVTPVVELALVDQGIGPMAQEQMNTPVEGDMGQGIMTMAANGNMGVGNEPPVNFNLGGEVRRRGDEDPVPVFMNGGPVQYMEEGGVDFKSLQKFMGPRRNITPEASQLLADRINQQLAGGTPPFAEGQSPTDQKVNRLKQLFEDKKSVYRDVLGDPEEQKKMAQAQMLFDIANTALTFAAPMPGEQSGLSAAQRLAMAASTTKLPQTIGARAAELQKDKQKFDAAALTAAEAALTAEEKAKADYSQKKLELENKLYSVPSGGKLVTPKGVEVAVGKEKPITLKKGETLIKPNGEVITSLPENYKLGVNEVIKDSTGKVIATGRIMIKGLPEEIFNKFSETDQAVFLGMIDKSVKGVPVQFFNQLSAEGQNKLLYGSEKVKGIPKSIFDSLSEDEQGKIMGTIPLTEETIKGIPKSIFNSFNKNLQNTILGATKTMKPGDKIIDVSTGNEIASAPEKTIYKQVNGQLVAVDPTNNSVTPIFGEAKIDPEYINVTINGVTTTVNGKTQQGFDLIAQANETNKVTPGSAIIQKIGTESTTQIKPQAFLLKDDNKLVTSYDNGKTYVEDGTIKPIVNGFPVASSVAYDVHSKEMVKFKSKVALAEVDKTLLKNLGPNFEQSEINTVGEVLQKARDGTGFGAQVIILGMKAQGILPEFIRPSGIINVGKATLDANNYMKTLTVLGRSSLVVNNKFPVAEMQNVAKLFPDAEAFFTNPDAEARKIVNLRNVAVAQYRRNLKMLEEGVGDQQKEALLANNLEIQRLISLTGGFTSGASSNTSMKNDAILKSKEAMERK